MLEKIINHKKTEVLNMKRIKGERTKEILDFGKALKERHFIFEIKKASPSKGDLNLKVDVAEQARLYERSGAACISVLTDSTFFKGSYADLNTVAKSVNIPVLCKDFVLSDIQIENAFISGADAVLLIVPVLSDKELHTLSKTADGLGLSVLYEIHNLSDFERISERSPSLVGVNARNFHTMTIEKETSAQILNQLNGDFLKIAESGICSESDIDFYLDHGADGFLIGTSVMSSSDPERTIRSFHKRVKESVCL